MSDQTPAPPAPRPLSEEAIREKLSQESVPRPPQRPQEGQHPGADRLLG